jgi:hypothetical protein
MTHQQAEQKANDILIDNYTKATRNLDENFETCGNNKLDKLIKAKEKAALELNCNIAKAKLIRQLVA